MDKKDLVLAALSVSNGALHTPVQMQKLLFLIEKKVPNLPGSPYFDFVAYDYGPFDVEVYSVLRQLKIDGDVEILPNLALGLRQYRVSCQGQAKGQKILNSLDSGAVDYIQKLSHFVRSLSFAELVSAIYKEYPDMKSNSLFRG